MALRPVMMSLVLTLLASASANLRAIKNHQQSSACECLEWKEVYNKREVRCRDTNHGNNYTHAELAPLEAIVKMQNGSDYGKKAVADVTCDKFFKRLPENFCVNKDWEYNDEEWCYVSDACKTAKPAAEGQVSIKTCGTGDKKLSDLSPMELYEMSNKNRSDLDVGMLTQFAFKHWTSEKWSEVEAELMNDAGPSRADLKELVASNEPVLFHFKDVEEPLPFHIVKGNSVYEIHAAPGAMLLLMVGEMGSACEMTCLKGCA